MPKIVLVEDDKGLGYILKEYLMLHHFQVQWYVDGREAIQVILNSKADLYILDVALPHMDGFEVAKKIKQALPAMPIIFLTARSLKVDKLKGFSFGADDYLVKPVDEEELVARIHTVLSRYNSQLITHARNTASKLHIGKYEFDPVKQELVAASSLQKLTKKESELLTCLIESKNQIVERKFLLESLWGGSSYFTRRSMDVHISKLRKYLSEDPQLSIENVHNKGFVLKEKS